MFRATILPIFKSIGLCNKAYGKLYPNTLPVGDLVTEELTWSVIQHFIFQLMHTTLKKRRVIKTF